MVRSLNEEAVHKFKVQVQSRHLNEGTEENHEDPENELSAGRYLNPEPLE
jgi:hypothetical protein